jgi:site-specific recombinase XerD
MVGKSAKLGVGRKTGCRPSVALTGSSKPRGGSARVARDVGRPGAPGGPNGGRAVLGRGAHPVLPLVEEWLLDVRARGRGVNTVTWYRATMRLVLAAMAVRDLEEIDPTIVRRYLISAQDRGLAANSVRGHFGVMRSFLNWCDREGYPVNPASLRLQPPSVPELEIATYTPAQVEAAREAARSEWGQLAVQILVATGMRVSELCALELTDFEDDPEMPFLKIRRGKGAKFRRVPVSHKLRKEIVRYVNRHRPETRATALIVLADGRAVPLSATKQLFRRIAVRVGFPIAAHKLRHTFATEYLRSGGDIERLRRILGHSTYQMVMRYVHLDKGDMYAGFNERTRW